MAEKQLWQQKLANRLALQEQIRQGTFDLADVKQPRIKVRYVPRIYQAEWNIQAKVLKFAAE